jgi:hypothetical protein
VEFETEGMGNTRVKVENKRVGKVAVEVAEAIAGSFFWGPNPSLGGCALANHFAGPL